MAISTTSRAHTFETPLAKKLLDDERISSYMNSHPTVAPRIRDAVDWIVTDSPKLAKDDAVKTVVRLFRPLAEGKLSVFFSYKSTDMQIAIEIAKRLKAWSGSKLIVHRPSERGEPDGVPAPLR